jgi:hypothetical protein
MTGVQFIYVSSEQTKAKHTELKSIKAKPLNQTMKLHAVGATDDSSKLMTRNTSCYCNYCIECAYCDSWITQQFIWSGIVLPIHDHQMEQEEAEATETERIEDTDPEQKVKVGDFVAVVYDAK